MLLEDDVLQPRHPLFQAGLFVGLEEEGGIAEPRPDHPLVAGDDLDGVLALYIGDGDEIGSETTLGIHQVKIFLVLLHGGDQRLGGHFQEALLEGTGQCHRPLHQACHLVQQVVIDNRCGLEGAGLYLHLVANHFPPLLEAGHHLRRGQGFHIVLRTLQGDVAAAVETMATGDIARGQAEDFAVVALGSQHGHHPVHRAYELNPAGTPAHALGDGQPLDTAVDDVVQAGAGAGAPYVTAQAQPGAFRRVDGLQLLRLHPLLAGETPGGRGPVAVLVAGLGQRRPQGFNGLVRCL